MKVLRVALAMALLLGALACHGPDEQIAQISRTPMKPNDTPAAVETIHEGETTPVAMP